MTTLLTRKLDHEQCHLQCQILGTLLFFDSFFVEYKLASNGELTVVERLASLLETGQYADVTIRVGEGDDVVTFKVSIVYLKSRFAYIFFFDYKDEAHFLPTTICSGTNII